MKRRALIVGLSVAVGVLALGAVLLWSGVPLSGGTTASNTLRPDDARLLALGEKVYRAQCASCHGVALEGQPNWRDRGPDDLLPAPPHDASGHTWHHPDEVLFAITKHGVAKTANLKDYKTAMPVYDGVLSDEEIVAVLSWIKAQWPPPIRAKHDQINAQASQGAKP